VSEQDGPPPPPPPRIIETDAEQVACSPAEFTAVPVNSVSSVIDFESTEPPLTSVTAPTSLPIEKLSALVVVQVSEEWSPELTLVGDAESVHVGAIDGGGGGTTITFAEQVV